MLRSNDICMFCDIPHGNLRTKHLCLDTQIGYYSCSKPECVRNMFTEINRWHKESAYGDVKYLKDRGEFKILRSNGEIETNWSFASPVVLKDINDDNVIKCIMKISNLTRWCKIKMLCEQNPQEEIKLDNIYYESWNCSIKEKIYTPYKNNTL